LGVRVTTKKGKRKRKGPIVWKNGGSKAKKSSFCYPGLGTGEKRGKSQENGKGEVRTKKKGAIGKGRGGSIPLKDRTKPCKKRRDDLVRATKKPSGELNGAGGTNKSMYKQRKAVRLPAKKTKLARGGGGGKGAGET